MLFSGLEFVRIGSIGTSITNFDIVILVIWVAGIFIKISLHYYVSVKGISEYFNFESYKNMIIPVGIVIIIFSLTYSNNELVKLLFDLKYIFPVYQMLMTFIIPSILLITSIARRQKGQGEGATLGTRGQVPCP